MRLADPTIGWRRWCWLICNCSANDGTGAECCQRVPPAIAVAAVAWPAVTVALMAIVPAMARRWTAKVRAAITLPAMWTPSIPVIAILNLIDITLDDGLFWRGKKRSRIDWQNARKSCERCHQHD